ncbi:leucine-rich repeat protein (LRRP), putative [Trypanosoma brucei brucei TREU927]|uniref:Leucine-rich repeat protein (LRRP), putative n=2 Tax=Trypanosoma brucei TaxID=5691 RepID=Q57U25_TRYB2|nr:leucine-rich repeat protein (LRRP), putative [Trypanosoma brucei brucei TREU927]AAX70893.1 leucine-rich repeat protein (LRRP), putative [Trypanosoma brucei]AAZ12094.1 leucine-rich repeat protein (LRRP), putative [Trypanosoma brucei brucei TREU927]RHW71443.1 leucine-rich repeat protein (LRRP) [Trypanosoma brucei equiperdum]
MPNAIGLHCMSRMRELHLSGSCVTDRHLCNVGVGKCLVRLSIESCTNLTDVSLLTAVETLEEVRLDGCKNVVKGINEFGRMPYLRVLILKETSVTDRCLRGFASSRSLVKLFIESCSQPTDVSPISAVETLEEVRLDGCKNVVKGINEFGRMPYLRVLILREVGVTDRCLRGLSCCRSLVELALEYCLQLTDVSPISMLETLQKVRFDGCKNVVKGFGELGRVPYLQTLSLNETNVDDRALFTLRATGSLVELSLESCPQLTDVTHLSMIDTLQKIVLEGCANVAKGVGLLGRLPALRELYAGATSIADTSISALSRSGTLTKIDVKFCQGLTDVSPLVDMKLLEEINLEGCKNVEHGLPCLEKLNLLRVLHLTETQMTDDYLRGLCASCSIVVLDVSLCDQLVDMSPLASIETLEVLRANNCKSVVRGVGALGGLRALRELGLKATMIKNKSLCGLGQSRTLVQIDLEACERLTDVTPLSQIRTLEVVNLNGCKNVVSGLKSMAVMPRLRLLHLMDVELGSDVLDELKSMNVWVNK